MTPSQATLLSTNVTVRAVGCLNQIRVFYFDLVKVLLCLPVPDAVTGKDQVHFFQGSLVGLGIECPHNEDAEGVDPSKDIQRFFMESTKNGGEEQDLFK